LVITEASPGQAPQRFAIGGRFVGDLDGDGDDEIALPSTTGDSLELFFGDSSLGPGPQQERLSVGDTQLDLTPGCRGDDDLVHPSPLGDLDGDGREDLGIACFDANGFGVSGAPRGGVAIYWGRASPWPVGPLAPDVVLLGEQPVESGGSFSAGERVGRSVVALGDVDGDGFDDLLVTGEQMVDAEQSIAWVFRGGATARTALESTSSAAWTISGAADVRCLEPIEAAALGDIDAGGRPDFALICPQQPLPILGSPNVLDIDFSVFFGETLAAGAPAALAFSDRGFLVNLLAAQSPRGLAGAAVGDLDGAPGDEFALVSVQPSSIIGQVVQGHAPPWEEVPLIGPFPSFQYATDEENPAALQLAPAGSVVGSGPALWLRIGEEEDSRIGLLSDIDPSDWAEQSAPPLTVVFSPPGGVEPSSAERFAMGGRGDFDGDGHDDLLLISGFADGAACEEDECSGAWLVLCGDLDGDGISACAGDCDDRDASVSPVVAEQCDEKDHDCDGDDGQVDDDADGFATCAGDCDDSDPERFPGADEACGDGTDRDCDGLAPDDDSDGDESPNCEDCQPWLAAVNPEATELCDGLDTDCDGALPTDEQDIDQDGYRECEALGETADCDDLNPFVRPFRFEDCSNGIDDDCDGAVDEDEDLDADNVSSCEGDCLDTDATVFPGAQELCDGLDNNCNGVIDDARDLDGDGLSQCEGDCDDGSALNRPGATGVCAAGVDSNCDGLSDFLDNDGDGFTACGGDCDDLDVGISPRATDWCDRLDNNCDGVVDEPWDQDEDTWATCLGDCDDGQVLRYPQPLEPDCVDGIDGDCDGRSDSGDSDCPSLEERPLPQPRPYGFACADCQGSVAASPGAAGSWLVLFLLLVARRRRSLRSSPRRAPLLPVAMLTLLVVPSLAAPAEAARKERALVIYMSPQPDIRHMVEAREALPRIDPADVLHSSELFDSETDQLVVVGAKTSEECSEGGPSPALQGAVDGALEHLINVDNLAALRVLDAALDSLACLSTPLPRGALPTLHYYRGVVDFNLGRPEKADASFKKLLALDSDFTGDPNFPPPVNARLDRVRSELASLEPSQLLLFAQQQAGLRVDGRRVDAAEVGQGLELTSGQHIVQLTRGRAIQTVLLEIEPGATVVVLHPDDRNAALLEIPSSPAARAYATGLLGMAAAEEGVELVVLLDLESGEHSFSFRPDSNWFSFDGEPGSGAGSRRSSARTTRGQGGGSAGGGTQAARQPAAGSRSSGTMSMRSVGGGGDDESDRLRLRLSGGYAYVHPYSYVHMPLDVTVRLWKGLCLDLGGEWSASSAEVGVISLPAGSVGLSYRVEPADAFHLRVGALGRISADKQEAAETRPLGGWAVRVGADILPPVEHLLVGFDVQGGMLGKTFYLSASFGMGLRL